MMWHKGGEAQGWAASRAGSEAGRPPPFPHLLMHMALDLNMQPAQHVGMQPGMGQACTTHTLNMLLKSPDRQVQSPAQRGFDLEPGGVGEGMYTSPRQPAPSRCDTVLGRTDAPQPHTLQPGKIGTRAGEMDEKGGWQSGEKTSAERSLALRKACS